MHFNKNKAIPAFPFENKDWFHVAHFFSAWSSFTSFISCDRFFSKLENIFSGIILRGDCNPGKPIQAILRRRIWLRHRALSCRRPGKKWCLVLRAIQCTVHRNWPGTEQQQRSAGASHTFVHFRYRQNVKAKAKLFSAWFCKNSHKTNKW